MECMKHAQHLFQSTSNIQVLLGRDDVNALSSEEAQFRETAGHFLVNTIKRHRQMPMGLGSGATTLEHKCQALAIKFCHETHSFKQLRDVCDDVFSLTVDLGVEKGISDAHGGDAVQYLPAWMSRQDRLHEDAGVDAGHVSSQKMFGNSVISAGLDHISNNMQDAMDKQLQGWEDWLPGFKSVTYLLSHRHLLQRLIGRCINGTPHAPLARCFETCVASVAHWRWGAICKTLPDVLRLERALRLVWNQEVFLRGDEDIQESQNDSTFNVGLISKAIESVEWWSYGHMLVELHAIGNIPSAWGSGCACHEWVCASSTSHPENVVSTQILLSAREAAGLGRTGHDGVGFDCPLKGKRAPEIASGKLLHLVAEHSERGRAEVLMNCSQLSAEQREKIVNDFSLGVDYIQLTLELKTGHWWQALPWMLAALGLPQFQGPGASQEILRKAMDEFGKVPCEPVHHDALTWKIFQPRSQIRAQIQHLLDDGNSSLRDMHELYSIICRLAFIPIVERIVEGAHSLVHRHTGYRKVSGAYISVAMRLSEMDEILKTEAGKSKFIAAFTYLRNSRHLTKSFRLQEHPMWLELVGKPRSQQSGQRKLCNAMMYSTDTVTMFVKHKEARKKHDMEQQRRNKARGDLIQRPVQSLCIENIMQKAFVDFALQTLRVGEFYSIPVSELSEDVPFASLGPLTFLKVFFLSPLDLGCCCFFKSIDMNLISLVPTFCLCFAEPRQHLSMGHTQLEDEAPATRWSPSDKAFFRVIALRAGKLRTIKSNRKRFQDGDVAITLHSGSLSSDSSEALANPLPGYFSNAGTNAIHVLSMIGLEVGKLSQISAWERLPECQYMLPGFSERQAIDLVAEFFEKDALEGRTGLVHEKCDNVDLLEHMLSDGLVMHSDSGWQMTKSGIGKLQVVRKVKSPRLIADLPAALQADATANFPLLLKLRDKGWTWRRLSKKTSPPYALGGPTLFYSSTNNLRQEYLMCLDQAEDVLAGGHLLYHGKNGLLSKNAGP